MTICYALYASDWSTAGSLFVIYNLYCCLSARLSCVLMLAIELSMNNFTLLLPVMLLRSCWCQNCAIIFTMTCVVYTIIILTQYIYSHGLLKTGPVHKQLVRVQIVLVQDSYVNRPKYTCKLVFTAHHTGTRTRTVVLVPVSVWIQPQTPENTAVTNWTADFIALSAFACLPTTKKLFQLLHKRIAFGWETWL